MSEPIFHPEMVQNLIELLKEVYWNSPISVQITEMKSCTEKINGVLVEAKSRMFHRDTNILAEVVQEIHKDLQQLERKGKCHYQISFYTSTAYTADPMYYCIRYAKHGY